MVGYDKKNNGIGVIPAFMFLIIWFFGTMIWGLQYIPTKWSTSGTYHLSSLSDNTYVRSAHSKSTTTNTTMERFDYYIEESPGKFRSYWVNKDYSEVRIKDGALDLEIMKNAPVETFAAKYVIPWIFWPRESNYYIFYVDPKYAEQELGIQVKK
jgi:hypothetical protein